MMAHHPRLLLGYGMFELAFERSNLVDRHLKSLAVLKAATMVGCEFCIDIGSALSRAEGVTQEQLRDLPDFERSEAFSLLEKLVLRYAAAVTRTPADVPDELFESSTRTLQRGAACRADHRASAGELPGPVQPRLRGRIARVLGEFLLCRTGNVDE